MNDTETGCWYLAHLIDQDPKRDMELFVRALSDGSPPDTVKVQQGDGSQIEYWLCCISPSGLVNYR